MHLRIWRIDGMRSCRSPLFRKRRFEPTIVVTWMRRCLGVRDLAELMADRGLAAYHHLAVVQRYGPEAHRQPQ